MLYNLLSNAIGFSEAGGRITLDCRRENSMLAFAVEDQGVGIPDDYQQAVFDRFESRTLGSRHRGAGLGLSIVKSLAELHGGTVSLDSAPGGERGSRCSCRSPRRRQQRRLRPTSPSTSQAAPDDRELESRRCRPRPARPSRKPPRPYPEDRRRDRAERSARRRQDHIRAGLGLAAWRRRTRCRARPSR